MTKEPGLTRSTPPHGGRRIHSAGAPLATARGAVVMLHGRGGSAEDILSLSAYFPSEDIAYLAPAAAGNVWYPQRFLEPRAVNEPFLGSALGTVANLLDDLNAAGLPDEKLVLLGFSQGACLALEAAARRPRRYGGVVALSGGLIGAAGELFAGDAALGGTPVLIGCSERDGHIPLARVEASAAIFEKSGAAVTTRTYPGSGHGVNDDEVGLVRTLLTGLGAAA